ncbi:MAG: HAMP domain-containing protein [Burkholderiaceae bacterium]|nr:HAMP domain-containing protein [Burkholderiaceae bacterium]
MKWLRFLWPRSLRTRLILLVLLTLAAAQTATLYSISVYQRNHAEAVSINLIATTIRTLHQSIDNIPPEDRAEFVRQASGGQWRLWSRALPDDARVQRRPAWRDGSNARTPQGGRPGAGSPGARPDAAIGNSASRPDGTLPPAGAPRGPYGGPAGGPAGDPQAGTPGGQPARPSTTAGRGLGSADDAAPDEVRRSLGTVVDQLNAQLGRDARVALSRGAKPEIFISFAPSMYQGKQGPREWLVIPIERIDPPVSGVLVAGWLAGLLLVIAVAIWFSWHITRPITRLVQATDQLAAGNPERVTPAGPTETRMLGERFNAMIEALAEAESTRRTLLAGLPHDLKGPLSRMWLRIEMTDDKTLQDGMRSDLHDMQRMVDQFIGYLRGTDIATYRFEPIALDEWVRERIASWTGAKSDIRLLGKPVPAQVNGDTVALARLLDNLVSNALHHGAPPVHVSLNVQDHWAVLRVSDHGDGIPVDQRADAVRPFVRLDAARTRSGNVGLGLAVADVIARAHGGSLSLGQGSEGGLQVEVRLPIHSAAGQDQAPDPA